MKSVTCQEIDRSLWRYIDRELAAGDIAAMSAHLRQCEACRALHHERARDARSYRMAFLETPFGPKFTSKLLKRMKQEGLFQAEPAGSATEKGAAPASASGSWQRRLGAPGARWLSSGWLSGGRGLRRIMALAAILLLIPTVILIGVIFNGPMPRRIATLKADGKVLVRGIHAGGEGADAGERVVKGALVAGTLLEVPTGVSATVDILPSSRGRPSALQLDGPCRLVFDAAATPGMFRATLEVGALHAKVGEQLTSESFIVETPHARASVVGTEFLLEAGSETKLTVQKGVVEFQALDALPGTVSQRVTPATGPYVVLQGSLEATRVSGAGPDPTASSSAAPSSGLAGATDAPDAAEPSRETDEPGAPEAPQPDGSATSPEPPSPPIPDLDIPVGGKRE